MERRRIDMNHAFIKAVVKNQLESSLEDANRQPEVAKKLVTTSGPSPLRKSIKRINKNESPKLDMNHGFVKAIVKNQIIRDEYHKAMKERQDSFRKKPEEEEASASAEQSRLYVPPHKRSGPLKRTAVQPSSLLKKRNLCPGFITELEEERIREKVRSEVASSQPDIDFSTPVTSSSSPVKNSRPLFILNLADSQGETVEIVVLSSDNAARLAKELTRKYCLNEEEGRLLRMTIESELEQRLASSG